MGIPTIYCDKKQALSGEEITVIASIGEGVWEFPNALSGDIEIVSGVVTDNVLTFKCLATYDPLTISFRVIENTITNGQKWEDTTIDGESLADAWSTPSGQENQILTGWNFEGNSQRCTQLTGSPSISQANLTVSGGEYTVELDYRAYSDIELKIGGNVFPLARTDEGPNFPIYPIVHDEGVIEFETTDGGNVKWIFADGSVENGDLSVSKLVPEGTSYLIMDSFVGQSIGSLETGSTYIGSLSDLPSGLSIVELDGTGVVGDIIELDHVQDVVTISNSAGVYGDISVLSDVSSVIDLSGSPNIYGDIENLDYTESIYLDGTQVSGTVALSAEATHWNLNNTVLSKQELETSLIRIANYASLTNTLSGYFECYDNMPTVNSVGGCNAISTLDFLDWTVIVHSECGGSGT